MPRPVVSLAHKLVKRAQINEDYAWPPLHPDRRCIEWNNAVSDPECLRQWQTWDQYCYWVKSDQCTSVDSVWYGQTLPDGKTWFEPVAPDAKCIMHVDFMDETCLSQWETLYNQCYMEGPFAG